MNEFLRPATLGEILDRTASLYRSRFLVLFGIASLPSAVILGFLGSTVLMVAAVGSHSPEAGFLVGFAVLLFGLIALPLVIGAQSLTGAALCHSAGNLVYGEKITIREAFRFAWRRGWRYVGLYLVLSLIIFGVPFFIWSVFFGVLTAVAAAGGQPTMGILFGGLALLLGLAIVAYVLWMLARLCLAFPISVIEQAGVTDSLRRAASLSYGTRWRMLVLFLLGLVLSWVCSFLVTVPLFVAVALIPGLNTPEHAQTVGTIAIIGMYGAWFVLQALTMPVYAIALVLFYYDQRVRKEGFDIELLMRQAGMAVEPPVSTEEPAAGPAFTAESAVSEEPAESPVPAPDAGTPPVLEAAAIESGSAAPSPGESA